MIAKCNGKCSKGCKGILAGDTILHDRRYRKGTPDVRNAVVEITDALDVSREVAAWSLENHDCPQDSPDGRECYDCAGWLDA